MILFKYLLAFGLLLADAPADGVDSDGWYTIPKPTKEEQGIGADEQDPSIWVVFSKQIGDERILVSLPTEPTYQYLDRAGEEMEVFSQSNGTEYRLQIIDQVYDDPNSLLMERVQESPGVILVGAAEEIPAGDFGVYSEVSYWKDGFWYQERVVVTSQHTYFLQTKSETYSSDTFSQFANSFNAEIRE